MTHDDVARAFSSHRFEEAFEHIDPAARWNLVGQAHLEGRDAIVEACRRTAEELRDVETTWSRFVSTGDGDVVAVDVVARYRAASGVSTVSSCDVYEFENGRITLITSYAVELPTD